MKLAVAKKKLVYVDTTIVCIPFIFRIAITPPANKNGCAIRHDIATQSVCIVSFSVPYAPRITNITAVITRTIVT